MDREMSPAELGEVITGELNGLAAEVKLLRQANEVQLAGSQEREIRMRSLERHLDRSWKEKAWTAFVITMIVVLGAAMVAGLVILTGWLG